MSVDAKVFQRCIIFPGKKKPVFPPMFYGAYIYIEHLKWVEGEQER